MSDQRHTIAAWVATIGTTLFTHLIELKVILEVLAWAATFGFTIWQWIRQIRKNKRDDDE
jgi:hypothetical protein